MAMMKYLYSAPLKIIIPKWRVCLTLKILGKTLQQVDIEGGTTIEESAQYLPQLFLVKELKHKTT
jgi:hypothetical protein